jgi:hypothetical protein
MNITHRDTFNRVTFEAGRDKDNDWLPRHW